MKIIHNSLFLTAISALCLSLMACGKTPLQPTVAIENTTFVVASSQTKTPNNQSAVKDVTPIEEVSNSENNTVLVRFVAVGDVMPGTDFPFNRLPASSRQVFAGVRDVLRDADVTFGNFEGSLLDGGEPVKSCQNPDVCYLFRTPTSYAETLQWAGFNVMSLANNHAADFGETGRNSSMRALQSVGIKHAGREGDIARLKVKDLDIAVIAFAPNRGNYSINDIPRAKQLVSELKKHNHLVVVSFHGGAEGAAYTRTPQGNEIFHGENRGDVIAFSRGVVDAGADLVIGHGPHVPRAMEVYKGKIIAYSLGNFATYDGINVRGVNGLAPILHVTLDERGQFKAGKIISATQQEYHYPILDPQHEALKLIRQLTLQDFAGGGLRFAENGEITLQ